MPTNRNTHPRDLYHEPVRYDAQPALLLLWAFWVGVGGQHVLVDGFKFASDRQTLSAEPTTDEPTSVVCTTPKWNKNMEHSLPGLR